MKLAIVCALTIVAVSGDDVTVKLDQIEDACARRAGSTIDDAYSLLQRFEVPKSRAAQCFAACLAKALKLLTSDNEIDVGQVKITTDSPSLINAAEACAYVKDADECVAAKKIIECVKMMQLA